MGFQFYEYGTIVGPKKGLVTSNILSQIDDFDSNPMTQHVWRELIKATRKMRFAKSQRSFEYQRAQAVEQAMAHVLATRYGAAGLFYQMEAVSCVHFAKNPNDM